jgi:hypothetical protein
MAGQHRQRFWLTIGATAAVSAVLTYGLDGNPWVTGTLAAVTVIGGWLARPRPADS